MRNKISTFFDGFFDALKAEEPAAEFKTAAQLILEFGQYVDAMAAANPHRFHHVYEWNQVGQEDARLFELKAIPSGSSVVITYEFKKSLTPNDNGVVFADKATVMESGQSVTTSPRGPVPINDGEMFRVGPFTFTPGGNDTNNAFRDTFMLYFASRSNLSTRGNKKINKGTMSYSDGYRAGVSVYDRIGGQ